MVPGAPLVHAGGHAPEAFAVQRNANTPVTCVLHDYRNAILSGIIKARAMCGAVLWISRALELTGPLQCRERLKGSCNTPRVAQFITYMDPPWFPRIMACDNPQD